MAAHCQWHQHVERAAVGVCQREEGEHSRTLVVQARADAEHHISAKVVVGEHHAFRESGGAGCVVDNGQFAAADGRIFDVGRPETVGVVLAETAGQVLHHGAESFSTCGVALGEDCAGVQADSCPQLRHCLEVEVLEQSVGHE